MRKHLIAAFLILFCTACSMFKNTTSNASKSLRQSSNQNDATLLEEKDWLSKTNSLTFYADSSNQDYTIQLWPKGMFTYSPENGFTGEAEKVLITGQSKSGSASLGRYNTAQTDKGKIKIVASAHKEEKSTDQQKVTNSSPSWKLMLIVTGLIVLVAWFSYKKITKVFKLKF